MTLMLHSKLYLSCWTHCFTEVPTLCEDPLMLQVVEYLKQKSQTSLTLPSNGVASVADSGHR